MLLIQQAKLSVLVWQRLQGSPAPSSLQQAYCVHVFVDAFTVLAQMLLAKVTPFTSQHRAAELRNRPHSLMRPAKQQRRAARPPRELVALGSACRQDPYLIHQCDSWQKADLQEITCGCFHNKWISLA